MAKLVVALDEDKLIWLRRIITDGDGEEALAFVKTVLEPKLREAEVPDGSRRTFDRRSPLGRNEGKVG
ncbi:MAG: hypothetical protein KKF41_10905 [Actinobacteria bacterium]|nr:hypothetical protein [Actinomycetota bacterium]MBU1944878.1 hypothetical protein [Actinomycetota bacterium]MBU2688082.1 hypothetical protein [Actinomycetota bacterium]